MAACVSETGLIRAMSRRSSLVFMSRRQDLQGCYIHQDFGSGRSGSAFSRRPSRFPSRLDCQSLSGFSHRRTRLVFFSKTSCCFEELDTAWLLLLLSSPASLYRSSKDLYRVFFFIIIIAITSPGLIIKICYIKNYLVSRQFFCAQDAAYTDIDSMIKSSEFWLFITLKHLNNIIFPVCALPKAS